MKLGAGTYLTKTVLLALFALVLCPVAARAADTAAGSPRPNFVVILIDDMGYGDIGPFGSKLNRTPCLDRMAAEGMKLTSFYAAPVCTPSRAQMMTGCYAKRVSLPNVLGPVSRDRHQFLGTDRGGLAQAAGLRHDVHRQVAPGRPAGVPADAARVRPLRRPALLQRHGRLRQAGRPPPAGAAAARPAGGRGPGAARQARRTVHRGGREVHHGQQGPPVLPLPAPHGRPRADPSGQGFSGQIGQRPLRRLGRGSGLEHRAGARYAPRR